MAERWKRKEQTSKEEKEQERGGNEKQEREETARTAIAIRKKKSRGLQIKRVKEKRNTVEKKKRVEIRIEEGKKCLILIYKIYQRISKIKCLITLFFTWSYRKEK